MHLINKNKKTIPIAIFALFFAFSIGLVTGYKFKDIYFKLLLPMINVVRGQPSAFVVPPEYVAVACPTDSIQIVYFGQSNTANWVEPKASLDYPDTLLQYDWRDGKCYKYREPLLGTDNKFGNIISYTAVKVAQKSSKPVLIIPFSKSPSSILNWAYGDMSHYHGFVLDRLKTSKLSPQIFIWHQGESDSRKLGAKEEKFAKLPYFRNLPYYENLDSNRFGFGLNQDSYQDALTKVYQRTMDAFPDAHFGIALVGSFCGQPVWQPVRDAQLAVAKSHPNALIVGDTDSIHEPSDRNGCHFTASGAEKVGNMYYQAIAPVLNLK